MEKINIKHVFIVACICLFCSFMSMCNSCTTKKEVSKLKCRVESLEYNDSLILSRQILIYDELKNIDERLITGADVIQLYLNTSVNSPRTIEQISKDSTLNKIMNK